MGADRHTTALAEFARARGLRPVEHPSLPQLTPLLARGDIRRTDAAASGTLAEGVEGDLAHFTYTERDSDGSDHHYPFTLVLTAVPEITAFVPRLTLKPSGGPLGRLSISVPGFGDGDTMDAGLKPVTLESEDVNKRWDLWVDSEVVSNWVRQLFSPAFISWLTTTRSGLAFELADGALCVYRSGKVDDPGELADLCDSASRIAARLREEALEEEGRLQAGTAALPDRPGESRAAKVEAGLAEVTWDEPPPDARTAIAAYRKPSMRRREPWQWGAVAFLGALAVGVFLTVGDNSGGIVVFGLSPFVAYGVWKNFVDDRAKALGKEAFARGYARSRGLGAENPRLFQARHMRLRLPGVVESALSGRLPGGGEGAVLFLCSKSGKTSSHFNALVTEVPSDVELPPDVGKMKLVRHEKTVAVCEPSSADTSRTAAEIDEFVARAEAALQTRAG